MEVADLGELRMVREKHTVEVGEPSHGRGHDPSGTEGFDAELAGDVGLAALCGNDAEVDQALAPDGESADGPGGGS